MSALWNNRLEPIIVYHAAQAAGIIAVGSLAVAAGDSRIVKAYEEYADAFALLIGSPHDLKGSTYTIMVNDREDGTGSWRTFTDAAGTALAPPGIDKTYIIAGLAAAPCFKLVGNAAPSGDVTFVASKQALT